MMDILFRIFSKVIEFMAMNSMKRSAENRPQMAVIAGDYISMRIMLDGRYENLEIQTLERKVFPRLNNRQLCIDVGANIGNHSIAFSRYFEEVIAFEPNPRTFDILKINAKWNKGVIPVRLGASNDNKSQKATFSISNRGSAHIVKDSDNCLEEVVDFELIRLDDYIKPEDYKKIGLIKIDAEGHELEAIQGMLEIIHASKPLIILEVLKADFVKFEKIKKILADSDYHQFYEVGKRNIKEVVKFKLKNYRMVIAKHSSFEV